MNSQIVIYIENYNSLVTAAALLFKFCERVIAAPFQRQKLQVLSLYNEKMENLFLIWKKSLTPIEIVADERTKVYSTTRRINPNGGKVLRVRCEERQVTLRKWKEWLSGSSKGEWTHLEA